MENNKEKKTLKETVKDAANKLKHFWEENKIAIIAGTVGVASTATLIALVSSEGGSTTDIQLLPEPDKDPEVPKPRDVRTDFDDKELKALVWNERGGNELEEKLYEKFREIDDLCEEHDIAVGVFTTFGDAADFDDGCIEYFADGSKIKDNF